MVALLSNPSIPRPICMARKVTEKLSLCTPVDVPAVIQAAGLTLREVKFTSNVDGCLAYHRPSDRFGILVNRRIRDPLRRRLTLAHELGHYVLHRNQIRASGNTQEVEEPWMEAEAYQFAAELLMPADQVRFHLTIQPWEVKHIYQVSMSAWYRRLSDFGYHVHPRYR